MLHLLSETVLQQQIEAVFNKQGNDNPEMKNNSLILPLRQT